MGGSARTAVAVLSVNDEFSVNLTTFALQPARPDEPTQGLHILGGNLGKIDFSRFYDRYGHISITRITISRNVSSLEYY